MCPLVEGEAAPAAEGIELIPVEDRPPPFRSVLRHISDPALERRFTVLLRETPPDVVHLTAFGGSTPSNLAWIAERLGVPSAVRVDLAEVLCHRGTLVDETGAACTRWSEPDRCVACCGTPYDGGLTGVQAVLARLLRLLGGASPFPNRLGFRNRLDLLVYGLLSARCVLVEDEEARAVLGRAGVPRRRMRIVPEGLGADRWVEVYRDCE